MGTAIQTSVRRILVNLVPVVMIVGMVNVIDVEAAIYYVSTSGNNANSCATAQGKGSSAKRNVSQALACLSPGDTLRIQAGTYTTPDDRINSARNPFPGGSSPSAPTILEANPGDTVMLAPSDNDPTTGPGLRVVNIESGSNITVRNLGFNGGCTQWRTASLGVDNLVFSGNDVSGGVFQVIGVGGTNVQILNNTIHDTCHTAVHPTCPTPCGYGVYTAQSGLLFEGNTMHHLSLYAFHAYPPPFSGMIIRNNIFHDNGIDRPDQGADILMYGTGHQVYNNVFYNTSGGAINTAGGSSSNQILNNTIYNPTVMGVVLQGSSQTVDNNLIINAPTSIINTCSGCTVGSHNITSGTAASIFTDV